MGGPDPFQRPGCRHSMICCHASIRASMIVQAAKFCNSAFLVWRSPPSSSRGKPRGSGPRVCPNFKTSGACGSLQEITFPEKEPFLCESFLFRRAPLPFPPTPSTPSHSLTPSHSHPPMRSLGGGAKGNSDLCVVKVARAEHYPGDRLRNLGLFKDLLSRIAKRGCATELELNLALSRQGFGEDPRMHLQHY